MPNPLFNFAKNVGNRAPNRQRITPVPERYEGDNHPYRGVETHGVPDTGSPSDPMVEYDNEATHLVEYYQDPPEPDPIPVKVVGQGGGSRIGFRSGRLMLQTNFSGNGVASTSAVLVMGRNDKRIKTRLYNLGTRPMAIATDPHLLSPGQIAPASGYSGGTGFILESGNQIDLTTTEPIWAVLAPFDQTAPGTANQHYMGWYYEFIIPDE